jgi:hypothetical protein
MDKKLYAARLKVALLGACNDTNFHVYLETFGAKLIEQNKWNIVSQREAISLYLAKKHGWTIHYCRDLSDHDLRLILSDEIVGWKVPSDLELVFDPVWKAVEKLLK